MSEFDNANNGSYIPESGDNDAAAEQNNLNGTQPEQAETVETPTVDEIAEKYSQQPENEQQEVPAYGQTVQPQQNAFNGIDPNMFPPQQPYMPQQNIPQQPQFYQPQFNAPQQPPTPPKKKKTGMVVFFVILAAVILVAGAAGIYSLVSGRTSTDTEKQAEVVTDENGAATADKNAPSMEIKQPTDGSALTPTQIYKKISPSIVAVKMYSNDSLSNEGTGIIWKEDATSTYTYIVTCAHMLDTKGTTAVVQLADGKRYDAEIVGYDNRTDVGVLRIKAKGLAAAEFGDSDKLSVGDPIYAIGNPGGSEFFGSFTDGIVSAIGRTITSSIGYDMICIQHNAAISPGNSGGALVNQYGQVIGINSSKIAATDYEGMSFAIPITQAKDVITKVAEHGYVPGRAKLGISYVANNSSSVNSIYSMAVQMKGLPSGSLVIYKIDTDSSLRGTDVQAGDMIIAVNGKKMDTADVLLEAIDKASVGDEMKLTLFRISSSGGQYKTSQFDVSVKLVEEKNSSSDEEQTTQSFNYENPFGF